MSCIFNKIQSIMNSSSEDNEKIYIPKSPKDPENRNRILTYNIDGIFIHGRWDSDNFNKLLIKLDDLLQGSIHTICLQEVWE